MCVLLLILNPHEIVKWCFFIKDSVTLLWRSSQINCRPTPGVWGTKWITVSGSKAKPSQILPCVTQYNHVPKHGTASASGWFNPDCEVLGAPLLIWVPVFLL